MKKKKSFKRNIFIIALSFVLGVAGAYAIKQYFSITNHPLWPSKNFPADVDFYTAMTDRKLVFNIHSPDDQSWYTFFAELYNKNKLSNMTPSEKPLIPLIIHQIWLGSPRPEYFRTLNESWQRNHPQWTYKLWTDADVKNMSFENRKQFDIARNYGQKSDILRYHLLDTYGGVYVDMDFAGFLPLDILNHCYEFYTGISNAGDVELCNAFIASAPHHPIIKKCIETIGATSDEKIASRQFGDIISSTGPGLFTKCFMEVAPTLAKQNKPIIALPCTFLYPLPNIHRTASQQEANSYIKPESFGMHLWACTWLRPEANVQN